MRTAPQLVRLLRVYLSPASRSTASPEPSSPVERTSTFFVEAAHVLIGLGSLSLSLEERLAPSARTSQLERLALRPWCVLRTSWLLGRGFERDIFLMYISFLLIVVLVLK